MSWETGPAVTRPCIQRAQVDFDGDIAPGAVGQTVVGSRETRIALRVKVSIASGEVARIGACDDPTNCLAHSRGRPAQPERRDRAALGLRCVALLSA